MIALYPIIIKKFCITESDKEYYTALYEVFESIYSIIEDYIIIYKLVKIFIARMYIILK